MEVYDTMRRPLTLSLSNLPPTTTMKFPAHYDESMIAETMKYHCCYANATAGNQQVEAPCNKCKEQEKKTTKRSLDTAFEEAAGQRSAQLEHIMFNHYREDHERQVRLKDQYKQQLEVVDARCTRLHQHGIEMAVTIDHQAEYIRTLQNKLEQYQLLSRMMNDIETTYDDEETIADDYNQEIIDLTTDEELEPEQLTLEDMILGTQ